MLSTKEYFEDVVPALRKAIDVLDRPADLSTAMEKDTGDLLERICRFLRENAK